MQSGYNNEFQEFGDFKQLNNALNPVNSLLNVSIEQLDNLHLTEIVYLAGLSAAVD